MRLAAAALLALVLPASASAATARVEFTYDEDHRGSIQRSAYAVYRGGPEGETVTLRLADRALEITSSSGIAPGDGCSAAGPRVVVCSAPEGITWADIDTGAGDDRVGFAAGASGSAKLGAGNDVLDGGSGDGGAGDDVMTGSYLDGGPGDDRLTAAVDDYGAVLHGGDGRDLLAGGGKDDTLVGGGGPDRLESGEGHDTLNGDGPPVFDGRSSPAADDLIDGGAGVDSVSYADRSRPVRVDLAGTGPAGQAGERDVLAGIEGAIGGTGRDVLRGDDASNSLRGHGDTRRGVDGDVLDGRGGGDHLAGGPGPDRISGGEGADSLEGHGGRDRLLAGAGDDRISVRAREYPAVARPRVRLACGRGADTVDRAGRGETIPRDCETVWAGFATVRGLTSLGPGRTVGLLWESLGGGKPCRSLVQITDPGGIELGRAVTGRLSTRRTVRARVRLNPRGRRLIARPGRRTVVVRIGYSYDCRGKPREEAALRVRA